MDGFDKWRAEPGFREPFDMLCELVIYPALRNGLDAHTIKRREPSFKEVFSAWLCVHNSNDIPMKYESYPVNKFNWRLVDYYACFIFKITTRNVEWTLNLRPCYDDDWPIAQLDALQAASSSMRTNTSYDVREGAHILAIPLTL